MQNIFAAVRTFLQLLGIALPQYKNYLIRKWNEKFFPFDI